MVDRDLYNNQLAGNIPSSLGQLTDLFQLYVGRKFAPLITILTRTIHGGQRSLQQSTGRQHSLESGPADQSVCAVRWSKVRPSDHYSHSNHSWWTEIFTTINWPATFPRVWAS